MSEEKREPAVVDGRMVYTSISAVNRHAACNRSWWYRYHERLPDPAGKAAQAGTEAHARLTAWVNDGVDVLKPLEREGLPYIRRGSGAIGEQSIEGLLYWKKLRFKGGIDHLETYYRSRLVVTDYKFKGEIGISRDALTDPHTDEGRQMLTYAEAATVIVPEAKDVRVQHLHFKTKGKVTPQSVLSIVAEPLAVDDVHNLWDVIGRTYVDPIHDTAAAAKPEDVKANRQHCFKYHKACPYYDRCPQNVSFQSLFGSPKEHNVGLLDQFKKANSQVEHFPVAPAAPPSAVEATPVVAPGGGTATVAAVLGGPATVGELLVLPDGETGRLAEILPGGIGRFILSSGAQRDVAFSGLAAPAPVTDPKADTIVEENAVAKKTRAKKVKDPGPQTDVVEAPTPTPTPGKAGINLFVGCAPVGIATKLLHEYTAKIEAEILKTLEEALPDMRLSGHEMLGFGRWKAVLKQSVLKSPPPPGSYIIPAVPGEVLQVVTDALMGIADLVVLR